MKFSEEQRKQIEKIIGAMHCPKDFRCYKSGFEGVPKVKQINMTGLFECLEKDRQACEFATPFADKYYCQCPLLRYAVEKLGL